MKTLMLICLLGLTAISFAGQNVVVVVDNSGSMSNRLPTGETRMAAAQKALTKTIQDLPADTTLGIILLNGDWKKWPVPLGPLNKQQTIAEIKKFYPTGGTPLGGAMKAGTDVLLKLREKEHYGTYTLLIVSDGEASDPQLVEKYLPDMLTRGITIDVIGLDMAKGHSLSTKVHHYQNASDEKALHKAIAKTFAETGSDDKTSREDFQIISALSDDLAVKSLQALQVSGNHPIGEDPLKNKTSAVGGAGGVICIACSVMGGIVVLAMVFNAYINI